MPTTLRGPDVAVVGWIPYYASLSDLPPGHAYPESLATHLLFNSGNPEPPQQFTSFDVFADWVTRSKDYRVAVCLHDVYLRTYDDQTPPEIHYKATQIVGHTPLKLVVHGHEFRPPTGVRYPKGRVGGGYLGPEDYPVPEARGWHIRNRFPFKLSYMLDALQTVITGRPAPNAWAELSYEIRANRKVTMVIQGTAIPSQRVYVDWQAFPGAEHDMMRNSLEQVNGFLNVTPGCSDASEGWHIALAGTW